MQQCRKKQLRAGLRFYLLVMGTFQVIDGLLLLTETGLIQVQSYDWLRELIGYPFWGTVFLLNGMLALFMYFKPRLGVIQVSIVVTSIMYSMFGIALIHSALERASAGPLIGMNKWAVYVLLSLFMLSHPFTDGGGDGI